jgi:predicted MFS family arabinose efflux permease
MTSSASAQSELGVLARPAEQARPQHRLMLFLLLLGQGMAAMDTSIVNVAAPALHADFGITGALLQMAVAGYGLAYAVFLITGARLGNDHGYRRLFVLGVALFTVASLACGLAPSVEWLIAGRLVQGLGAAILVPQVLSLIQRSFEGTQRARAIGYYSMIMGLGSAAGQMLGGVLVSADLFGLSWRPAFLINVPIGIAVLLCARTVLPKLAGERGARLDLVGVAALTLAMLLTLVPLTFGQEVGWPSWTWASLAAGAVGMGLFLLYEKWLAQRGGSPLLNLDALTRPGIRPGLAVIAIGFTGYGGWLFASALYLQSGLGSSALVSGAVFAAYAFGFGIANVSWSKLPAPLLLWTPTTAIATMGVVNLAFGWMALRAGWQPAVMVPLMFLAGSSHGLSFGTTVNQMTQRVLPPHVPVLSGLVTTAAQLSIVVGIAVLGALYLSKAVEGSASASAAAIAAVTFSIAAAAVVGVACAWRLATTAGKPEGTTP